MSEPNDLPKCPKCQSGINSLANGGSHRCFHCNSCAYVECAEPCVCHAEGEPSHEMYRREQQKVSHLEAALAVSQEMLRLVLPLAKGYAVAHPVGSNQEYVDAADAFLKLDAALTRGGG